MRANAGQAAKFLSEPDDKYEPEHLQAALVNALRRIDELERAVAKLQQSSEGR